MITAVMLFLLSLAFVGASVALALRGYICTPVFFGGCGLTAGLIAAMAWEGR